MKYDLCLGNPPFSEKNDSNSTDLDSFFLLKAMENADKVTMIMRSKHFCSKISLFRRNLFLSGKVVELKYVNVQEIFPTIAGTEVCIISVDNNHKGLTRLVYSDGTIKKVKLDGNYCVLLKNPDYDGTPLKNNLAHRWERGKLKRRLIKDTKGSRTLIEHLVRGVPIKRTSNQTTSGVGHHGVVFNLTSGGLKSGIGKTFVKPKEWAIAGNIVILKTDSKAESIKLKEYLDGDEFGMRAHRYRHNMHNGKSLFEQIGDIL